eukprot:TRINITY_DN13380_c0_g1_i1.p1 TRINITY_DN13380_c0_g1~~TRINITY_DN13380_c0_g1_i1.p1  ORF type:complete len:174 (-),score=21.21 TRINITY_DN13380_c0_g1_i1:250-771(-)
MLQRTSGNDDISNVKRRLAALRSRGAATLDQLHLPGSWSLAATQHTCSSTSRATCFKKMKSTSQVQDESFAYFASSSLPLAETLAVYGLPSQSSCSKESDGPRTRKTFSERTLPCSAEEEKRVSRRGSTAATWKMNSATRDQRFLMERGQPVLRFASPQQALQALSEYLDRKQ